MAQMEKRDEKTPLQEKLEEMAEDIGKLGTIFAILTFHVLMIRFIFEGLFFKHINLFGTVPMSKTIKQWKLDNKKMSDSSSNDGLRLLQAASTNPECKQPAYDDIKGGS